MTKTLRILRDCRDKLSVFIELANLAISKDDEKAARQKLANIGLIADDISGVIQHYLAFGEEDPK